MWTIVLRNDENAIQIFGTPWTIVGIPMLYTPSGPLSFLGAGGSFSDTKEFCGNEADN